MNVRDVLLTCGVALAVYAMVRVDLMLRARSAYLEGEKWTQWSRRPELKKAFFDAKLSTREGELSSQLASGRLQHGAYERQVGLARFERDSSLAESSLKYAFVWYQTAAKLFSPPESRWTAMARVKMLETRELWKKELDAHKVPYQDYMLE